MLAWLLPPALSIFTLSLMTAYPFSVKETPGMLILQPITLLILNLYLQLQQSDKFLQHTHFSLISLLTTYSLLTKRSLFLWFTIFLLFLLIFNTITHSPMMLSSVSLLQNLKFMISFLHLLISYSCCWKIHQRNILGSSRIRTWLLQ